MTKSNQLPFIKLNELNEANQIEHVIKSLVQQRIHSFESWLIKNSKEEVIPTFIIFGHAQYFKYLLNKPDEMRNCDIWKATAHISESVNKIRWSNLTLKCRSPYSYHHPIQVLKEYIFGKSLLQSSSENSVGDEGEKTCRICQVIKNYS